MLSSRLNNSWIKRLTGFNELELTEDVNMWQFSDQGSSPPQAVQQYNWERNLIMCSRKIWQMQRY